MVVQQTDPNYYYLYYNEEFFPRFSLSHNILSLLEGARLKCISYSQTLPLVKGFWTYNKQQQQ